VNSRSRKLALLFAALFALFGAAARVPNLRLATGRIAVAAWPYLPGSSIPLHVDGFAAPYQVLALGPGRVVDGNYVVPLQDDAGATMLVAGNGAGLATSTVRIARPPPANRPLLVVASYDDGLVFHDGETLSVRGVLATGGTPTDVALDRAGRVATSDTDGETLTVATLPQWGVSRIEGVAQGDEIAIDAATGAIFVTDRDVDGSGALTRIALDGTIARVRTGETAEGLAIDDRRQIVYVANTNDGTISAVDARTMHLLGRIPAVSRVFSLALSPDGRRLYAVSNQSANSPFGASGSVVALALRHSQWRIAARSPDLTFPLSAALDARTATLFVTDEELSEVYVLDARTLRPKRPPLPTCTTPWKPLLDGDAQRLYVPCAGADAIDVFDARALRRAPHAPFATGGYPLAIAAWHPSERRLLRERRRGAPEKNG